jgi:hypothetical protein
MLHKANGMIAVLDTIGCCKLFSCGSLNHTLRILILPDYKFFEGFSTFMNSKMATNFKNKLRSAEIFRTSCLQT